MTDIVVGHAQDVESIAAIAQKNFDSEGWFQGLGVENTIRYLIHELKLLPDSDFIETLRLRVIRDDTFPNDFSVYLSLGSIEL